MSPRNRNARSLEEVSELTPRRLRRFLRQPTVSEITGLPEKSLERLINEGAFPKPVRIGKRAVAWIEDEVLAWQEAKIAARDVA